jgi:hypothetical protein
MAKQLSSAHKATLAAGDAPAVTPAEARPIAATNQLRYVYMIKCSRKTTMKTYDNESFADCNSDELDQHFEDIDRTAVQGDGVWYYDQGNKHQHGSSEHITPPLHRMRGSAFSCRVLGNANGYALRVWKDLQANHPFEEEATAEEYKKAGCEQPGKGSSSSNASSRKRKAAADTDSAAAGSSDATDGSRAIFKQERLYVIDPWGADVRNIASSVLTVEVVQVAAETTAARREVAARRSPAVKP